jgi:type VI secretion system secreted protein VgrG
VTREIEISLPFEGASIESFESVERFSELFSITAVLICQDEVDFFSYIGQAATITINIDDNPARYFNGEIVAASFLEWLAVGFRYEIRLAPKYWRLTRKQNYKIFQSMTALDIVSAVISDSGMSAYTSELQSTTCPSRDYCVQYRETDFDFISRLLEEEGIYYYFQHTQTDHTMILCDGRGSHSITETLPFNPTAGAGRSGVTVISDWHERISTGAESTVVLQDYDFTKSATNLLETGQPPGALTSADTSEVFDYPGGYTDPSEGERRALNRITAFQRERRLYLGVGEAPDLACGAILTLTGHPIARLNQDYLVVALTHQASGQSYGSTEGDSQLALINVEAIPAATAWRPTARTPKPVARGPETALVTGASGDKITTDQYARVKVQFYWDRLGTKDENSSCWIRASNGAAHNGFGVVILPRIGDEVIIDFLDGNPDRPIITGRVYNDQQPVAHTLPDNMTMSYWRSETIGDSTGYDGAEAQPTAPFHNEISMEDKGGSETLSFYAQRNQVTQVGLDDTSTVQRDQVQSIRRNRTTNVKNNETMTVEQGDESHTVSQGKRTTSIQQNESLTVVQGDMSTTVSQGNQSTEVSMGNVSMKVDMGNMDTEVSLGNYSIKVDMGSISIEAMQSITLTVGQSSITINQMGVTIQGMMLSSQAQVSLEAKGLMVDVEGSALTTVKGGIVMIN